MAKINFTLPHLKHIWHKGTRTQWFHKEVKMNLPSKKKREKSAFFRLLTIEKESTFLNNIKTIRNQHVGRRVSYYLQWENKYFQWGATATWMPSMRIISIPIEGRTVSSNINLNRQEMIWTRVMVLKNKQDKTKWRGF